MYNFLVVYVDDIYDLIMKAIVHYVHVYRRRYVCMDVREVLDYGHGVCV